ncbi:MAG TPA: hypothetical protein VGW11_08915 [Solirubrobacteraceae bacterium]|nr:hypothetical protein [Solirubrobacteraceae bacterium]
MFSRPGLFSSSGQPSVRPLLSVLTVWAVAFLLAACGGEDDGRTPAGVPTDPQAQACESARERLQAAEVRLRDTARVGNRLDAAVEVCTQADPQAQAQPLTNELRAQIAGDAEVCEEAKRKALAAAAAEDRGRYEKLAPAAVDTCADLREQWAAEAREAFDQVAGDVRARIRRELEDRTQVPEGAPVAP